MKTSQGPQGPRSWCEDGYKVVMIQMYVSMCVLILVHVFMQIGGTVKQGSEKEDMKPRSLEANK